MLLQSRAKSDTCIRLICDYIIFWTHLKYRLDVFLSLCVWGGGGQGFQCEIYDASAQYNVTRRNNNLEKNYNTLNSINDENVSVSSLQIYKYQTYRNCLHHVLKLWSHSANFSSLIYLKKDTKYVFNSTFQSGQFVY